MPQFGRPQSDSANPGSYSNQLGSGVNLFNVIDETAVDDTDYIRSQVGPSTAVYVTKLSSLEDPLASTGHILRVRFGKDTAAGAQIDQSWTLRQGWVGEPNSLGTQITVASQVNVSNTLSTSALTLSGAEADAITDYTNLYLRVISHQV